MKFGAKMSSKPKSVTKKIDNARKIIDGTLAESVAEATLMLHSHVVRGVAKQSPGEQQTRSNPYRTVTASKEGDTPNVDMGVFLRSIQFEVDKQALTGYVGTNDRRGPWFEFGTKFMRPRPWLSAGYFSAKEDISKIFKKMKFSIKESEE